MSGAPYGHTELETCRNDSRTGSVTTVGMSYPAIDSFLGPAYQSQTAGHGLHCCFGYRIGHIANWGRTVGAIQNEKCELKEVWYPVPLSVRCTSGRSSCSFVYAYRRQDASTTLCAHVRFDSSLHLGERLYCSRENASEFCEKGFLLYTRRHILSVLTTALSRVPSSR